MSSPSAVAPTATTIDLTKGETGVHRREQRGERKHNRRQATLARQAQRVLQEQRLSRRPATEHEAAERWNAFYRTKAALFKDRHLLRESCPELLSPVARACPASHVPRLPSVAECAASARAPDLFVLEVGCGVGNTMYPILRANPRLFGLAFDISDVAVRALKASTEFRDDRAHAFVANAARPHTYQQVVEHFSPGGVHFVMAVWMLSALPAETRRGAVAGLADALRPGGLLFVRDYASGDMREARFANAGKRVVSSEGAHDAQCTRLFLRGDGTYAYFFEADELQALFEATRLICESCNVEERQVHNRKQGTTMHRRWIVAKFRKPS